MLGYEKLFGQLEAQLRHKIDTDLAQNVIQQVADALHVEKWEPAPDEDKWEPAEQAVQELAEDIVEMYNDGHLLPSQVKGGLQAVNGIARTLKLPIKAEIPRDAKNLLAQQRNGPYGQVVDDDPYDDSYDDS